MKTQPVPGVEDTQEEEDESHDALSVPPLDHAVLLGSTGAVQPNDAQEAGVTPALCEDNIMPSYLRALKRNLVFSQNMNHVYYYN